MNKIITLIVFGILLVSIASALTIDSVTTNPNKVQPGEQISLTLDIENSLSEKVENVIVSLDLSKVPFAPYQSSNTQTIEKIANEDEENVKFDLVANADANSGTYKIPVAMKYYIKGNNTLLEDSGIISLTINAEPEIKVLAENEGIFLKGKNAKLKIRVTNSGLGNAKLLTIKLGAVLGIDILGAKSSYIGDIDSDDFDTAEFEIAISQNAGSKINIPITLTYRDSTNKEIIKTANIEINVYTRKKAIELGLVKPNYTWIYLVAVVVLIIVWVLYRNLKKRAKRKKAESGR